MTDETEKMDKLKEVLSELFESAQKIREDMEAEQDKVAAEMDYDTKLKIVAWTFRKICEHALEGGSYRYLIYDRLGFNLDAYVVLYEAGGMEISNHFNLME